MGWPFIALWTLDTSEAFATTDFSLSSRDTSIAHRILPLTCTPIFIKLSLAKAGSNFGQSAKETNPSHLSLSQSSSAICGAKGESN